MFHEYPYTNFHELNADWIVQKIKLAITEWTQIKGEWISTKQEWLEFKQFVISYLENLNIEEEINKKLEEMANSGQLNDLLNLYFTFRLNIAWSVGGKLTDSNFKEALTKTLEKTNFIFIPKGVYNFDNIGEIEITDRTVNILLDPEATLIRNKGTDALFVFSNCSVIWDGGTIYSGTDADTKTMLYDANKRGLSGGALILKNCELNIIQNISVPWNKLPSIVVILNCTNTIIKNIIAKKCLEHCITILEHCVQTVVEQCYFDTIQIPNNPEGIYYCYAVSTGLQKLTDKNITPPDVLIYRNNVVKNSEDSGLDTHGATNVLIEGNIIQDCNTAITAYNDSNRVQRPENWIMSNVIIRNNKCESNYVYEKSNEHPFILVSSADKKTRSTYNYIIENNEFKTPNDKSVYGKCILSINRMSKVLLRNNIFEGVGSVDTGILVSQSDGVVIEECTFNNMNKGVHISSGARAKMAQNTFNTKQYNVTQALTGYNYIESDDIEQNLDHSVKFLDWAYRTGQYYLTTTFGICANDTYTIDNLNCHYENGILTSESPIYAFSNLTLITNTDVVLRVTKVISDFSANVRVIGELATGDYTIKMRPANKMPIGLYPKPSPEDLDDCAIGEIVWVNKAVGHQPVDWDTEHLVYTVLTLPNKTVSLNTRTQIAFASTRILTRAQTADGIWQTWYEIDKHTLG